MWNSTRAAMEVTVKKLEPLYPPVPQPKDLEEDEETRKRYRKRYPDHEAFTVHIGDHRILTVYTRSNSLMTKWVADVQKSYKNKKQHLIVGFCADRDLHNWKKGEKENPYDILTLCIGSHCLIYDLPDNVRETRGYSNTLVPESLKDFFSDRNTIFVGFDMRDVLEKLEEDQELEAAWKVDVHAIARRVFSEGHPCFTGKNKGKFHSLDTAAKMLLDMEVDEEERGDKDYYWWYDWQRDSLDSSLTINRDYVKNLTIDAFFCYQIGAKYADVTYNLSRKKYGYYYY